MSLAVPLLGIHEMKSCPKCETILEPWEISCHSCGVAILSEIPPQVSDIAPVKAELEEAYKNWLDKGKQALTAAEYEEACNCLREAVKRSRPLDDANAKETAARQALAEALEHLNKLQEAADQYRIIAQEQTRDDLREFYLKKSQDLVASASSLPYDLLFQKEEFRAVQGDEARIVPLYCLGCKRLLAEAEVYGFRRQADTNVRCWCGVTGRPLAKQDAKHSRAMQNAQESAGGQRARAIAIASKELSGGKKKSTAALLALFTGWAGGHKFYLGESTAGFIYLLWFWTFIPFLISLYEAIVLLEMSITTFNMTYNIEMVLQLVEPPEEKTGHRMDIFSMEISQEDTQIVEAAQSDS